MKYFFNEFSYFHFKNLKFKFPSFCRAFRSDQGRDAAQKGLEIVKFLEGGVVWVRLWF